METTTATQTTTQQDLVNGQFAAALRQHQYYSHGRSLRKFCEYEGLDYQKFCKYAREHGPGSDVGKQHGSADALSASFIDIPQEASEESVSIREIRIDYSKQEDYTGNAIYHSLGEYFTLGEGETLDVFLYLLGVTDDNLNQQYPQGDKLGQESHDGRLGSGYPQSSVLAAGRDAAAGGMRRPQEQGLVLPEEVCLGHTCHYPQTGLVRLRTRSRGKKAIEPFLKAFIGFYAMPNRLWKASYEGLRRGGRLQSCGGCWISVFHNLLTSN